MNRWTTGIFLALGSLAPTVCPAQGPWAPPGVQQSGYHSMIDSGPAYPQAWGAPQYCPPGNAEQVMAQLVPGGPYCYDTDSRAHLDFSEAMAGSYFRLDYLLWDITDGKGTLLGAPVSSSADLSGQDRNNRLPAVDPITGPRALTSAIVPSIGEASKNDLNGLRATLGVPMVNGVLEAEIFTLQQAEWNRSIYPFVDQPFSGLTDTQIGATTLLNNGVPVANRMILYSQDYHASLKSDLWGTEGNWVFNPFTPNVPLEWSGIVGFRYLQLKDQLRINGTDIPDPVNDPTNALNHEILSLARNQIFGPQIGLRATTTVSRLQLFSELKLIAGINRVSDSVHTEQIFSSTEANVTDADTVTRFAPMLDLSVYGKFQMNDYLTIFAGYDFLIGGGFSRSYNNIDYNSPGSVTAPSLLGLKHEKDSFMAHGLTLGGELTWR
ncbi:BBP7 family outer membrane beta-barrel protein [Planctomicrobium sp. SH664]|uniref:BBP7 family outer membrane beta-barrel protein n=1 Tax=Planctomicrobium sp. SH664 TaxID=3448125 RepID=UPI003F5BAE7C